MSETMSDEVESKCTGEELGEPEESSSAQKPADTAFITKSWREDLTLILEDKPLYVNSGMLAYMSPVFDALLSSLVDKEVALTGKKFDDFLEFLHCIYPAGKGKSITYDNVFKVAPLAHEYQVKQLASECDAFLLRHLSTMTSPNDVYQIMALSATSKMDTVTAKCIEIVAERPEDEFEESKSQFTYPEELLNTIAAKMLHSLKTKHKNVFGHMKTSRALYEFLGTEAKQQDLVDSYQKGQVVGDVVDLELNSSTLKASTKMHIGGKKFTFDVGSYYHSNIFVTVKCHSTDGLTNINCLCAIYVLNWMKGKNQIPKVSKMCLEKRGDEFTCRINVDGCTASLLRNEEDGFVCNSGFIKMRIYLFCL